MINCIGFLPKGINIERLEKFERDGEVLEKLKHLDLPIIDDNEEDFEDSENNEFVVESDLVVYSTPNNSELSYLQFHVYDEEHEDFVIHHDIYVFSSINDTEYIGLNNRHYVALATFDNSIMLYDALVKNPMTPQVLLEGHTGPVMAISKNSTSLFSGSEDKNIIEWDLERLSIKTKSEVKVIPEKSCVSNNTLFFGSKSSVFNLNTGEDFKLEGNIENMMIDGNDIYIGDSSGVLTVLDSRNINKSKYNNKVSDQPLTGLDVLKGYVSVSSLDGDLKVYDTSSFETKFSHKVKIELYSVKLSEQNVLFFGDAADNLSIKKLDDYIKY